MPHVASVLSQGLRGGVLLARAFGLLVFAPSAPAVAQPVPVRPEVLVMEATHAAPTDEPVVAVPFGPGERLHYQVKLGVFSAGDGYLAVEGVDTTRGRETYRLGMGLKGGLLFAKVDDRYESHLDIRSLVSRHFIRDIHEVGYKSYREWAIYPELGYWERLDESRSETMVATEPLDELAFIFWMRTLPLEVGEVYTYHRYFKNDGNPVILKVLRRERREVPAGEFDTIVIQPIIRTGGLFSEGGKAEIYLTDDADRFLVYLRSEIPIVGSVTLHLREVRRGTPLVVRSDAAAPMELEKGDSLSSAGR